MHWLSRNTRLADSTARQWTVNSYKTETSAVSRQNKTKKQTKISPVFPHLLLFCKTIVLFSRNLVHIHIMWLWLLWSSHASNVVSCCFINFMEKGWDRRHLHQKWRERMPIWPNDVKNPKRVTSLTQMRKQRDGKTKAGATLPPVELFRSAIDRQMKLLCFGWQSANLILCLFEASFGEQSLNNATWELVSETKVTLWK